MLNPEPRETADVQRAMREVGFCCFPSAVLHLTRHISHPHQASSLPAAPAF